jgi:hypothetical protein
VQYSTKGLLEMVSFIPCIQETRLQSKGEQIKNEGQGKIKRKLISLFKKG